MKATNELIKNFQYSEQYIDRLQESLISELNGLPMIQMKIHKGRAVFRCRKHTVASERFHFESDLSYRTDLANIKTLGRCNFYNSSKFYGSISSQIIELGYATSIFETSSLLRDDKDGYEIYTIGKWIAKEDIDVLAVKPPLKNQHDTLVNKELIEVFDRHFKQPEVTEHHKEFYELYGEEISKPVKTNENPRYIISALVSEILLQTQVGIVYPSVQSASQGFNVVFNPAKFDSHFDLQRVLIGDFFKFKKESVFRNLFISENPSVYPFNYKEVDQASYRSISQILDHFNKRGVDSEYIVSRLIDQIGGMHL